LPQTAAACFDRAVRRWLLAHSFLVAACGAAPAPASSIGEAAPDDTESAIAREEPPATPRELVALLSAIASGARPGSLEDHVDREFARLIPSGIELGQLFIEVEGCTPELEEGPGYGAIAIPPPMEGDSEEEIRRTEAIIEVLQASTEVLAACTVTRTVEEDENVEERVMLFAIAVGRRGDGTLVALAWRRFDDERH
jgi:hypothetical protein